MVPLVADMEYAVEARDADGMAVWPNKHRVRVTADQPPSVWFETPSEGFEVHTLAEVLMRARAKDDFGLSKLGIVFQVNNEEERELIRKRTKQGLIRARQAGKQLGKPSTIDRATVARILKLRNAGYGTKAIAKALDAASVAPPRSDRWSFSTIRGVLEREGAA